MPADLSQVRALSVNLGKVGGGVGKLSAAVVRKSAHDVEATAKQLAPVDTGALRSSISTTVTGSGSFSSMSAEIGPTANYGIYQEFGTARQAPQPFMGPALDAHTASFEAAMEQVAAKALGDL